MVPGQAQTRLTIMILVGQLLAYRLSLILDLILRRHHSCSCNIHAGCVDGQRSRHLAYITVVANHIMVCRRWRGQLLLMREQQLVIDIGG